MTEDLKQQAREWLSSFPPGVANTDEKLIDCLAAFAEHVLSQQSATPQGISEEEIERIAMKHFPVYPVWSADVEVEVDGNVLRREDFALGLRYARDNFYTKQGLGDAAKSGPGASGLPSVGRSEGGTDQALQPPIAPTHEADTMFDPPGECECKICGTVYKPENWREYGFCAECRFEEGKSELQAEVDAHQRFGDSGWDIYGSMADPNLDRGWLDGYKAARYDTMIEALKKERRATGPENAAGGSSAGQPSEASSQARDGDEGAGAPKTSTGEARIAELEGALEEALIAFNIAEEEGSFYTGAKDVVEAALKKSPPK